MSFVPNPIQQDDAFDRGGPSSLRSPSSPEEVRGDGRSDRQRTRVRPLFHLVEHEEDDRPIAEQFIAARFDRSFDATIETFMPRLFTMRDARGAIRGAFGLRSTSCRLFVEQYLPVPIETALALIGHVGVARRSIVEVGHFSGTFPGAMRAMIMLLAVHLQDEGFEWVVFSGTQDLRNAFARIDLHPACLQPARIESLAADRRAAWGHYYDHAPQVMAGRIRDGVRVLGRLRALTEGRP
jgi:hypothetical protein